VASAKHCVAVSCAKRQSRGAAVVGFEGHGTFERCQTAVCGETDPCGRSREDLQLAAAVRRRARMRDAQNGIFQSFKPWAM